MNFGSRGRGVAVELAERGIGAEDKRGAGAGLLVLRLGNKGNGLEIFAELVVFGIADQTDHEELGIGGIAELLAAEGAADGILALEDFTRELLVDDGHFGRGEIIVRIEIATGDERDAHGAEVAGTGAVEQDVERRAAIAGLPGILVPTTSANWRHVDLGGGDGAGALPEFIQGPTTELGHAVLGHAGGAMVDADGDDSLGAESGIDGEEVAKAADEEERAHQEDQGHGDLRDDQEAAT